MRAMLGSPTARRPLPRRPSAFLLALLGAWTALLPALRAQEQPKSHLPTPGQPGAAAPAANPTNATAPAPVAGAVKVTLELAEPPPPPFRAMILAQRTDAPLQIGPREILIDETRGDPTVTRAQVNTGLDVRDSVLRVVTPLEPGSYTFSVRAPGFQEQTEKSKITKEAIVRIDKLKAQKPVKLTIEAPTVMRDPQLSRAVLEWNRGAGSWQPVNPHRFEPLTPPPVINRDDKKPGIFTTSLPPGTYQVTVQGVTQPPPRLVVIAPDAAAPPVVFKTEELEKKPSFTLTVQGQRGNARYLLNGPGAANLEVRPGEKVPLTRNGDFQLMLPEQPPVLIWHGAIGAGEDKAVTLRAETFGKAAITLNTTARIKRLEVLDGSNSTSVSVFTEEKGDRTLYWVPAGRALQWRVVHHNDQATPYTSFDRPLKAAEVVALRVPEDEVFTTGKLLVRAPALPPRLTNLRLQLLENRTVVVTEPVHAPQTVLPVRVGTFGAILLGEVDGQPRALPLPNAVKITSDASSDLRPAEITANLQEFFLGKLRVSTRGNFRAPLVITAQGPEGAARPLELGETTLLEGAWLVTAKLEDRTVVQDVTVRFRETATCELALEQFTRGALTIFTSRKGAAELREIRRDNGDRLPLGAFTDISNAKDQTYSLAFFDGLYRADLGRIEGGSVKDGVEEGVWTIEAAGRKKTVLVKGTQHQAVVLLNENEEEFSNELRKRMTLAPLAAETSGAVVLPNGRGALGAEEQPKTQTKQQAKTEPEPSKKDPPPRVVKAWPIQAPVEIEVAGRPLKLLWHDRLGGWFAATTVPANNLLPRNYSYAEALRLIQQLNIRYKNERGEHEFALPTPEQWELVAGRRTPDQLRHAVLGKAAAERVDAQPENGFSHLYGNVWQWATAGEADGKPVLRAVGGSFRTTRETWPPGGVTFIRKVRENEELANVGLRLALVPSR